MIEAAAPKDEIEGALAVQMACTHTAAMAVLAKLDSASERQVAAIGSAAARLLRAYADPPPLKWSDLKYVFWHQGGLLCRRRRYTPEEIVAKLRQVDVLVSQGQNIADAIRQIGVSEVTYYRWRQEYGGLKIEQVKRLKELETENTRLRRASPT